MAKTFLVVLLTGLLLFCFSQEEQIQDRNTLLEQYRKAEEIYRQALHLSFVAGENEQLQEKADHVFEQALASFNKLTQPAERSGYDSLAFFIYTRTGFISYYLGSITPAQKDYGIAITLKKHLPDIIDSFLFIPYLYTGSIYYGKDQFDSALIYYKKAEAINDHYARPLTESQRLYNRLGVMYYETGNYRLARTYFEKSISVLMASENGDKNLLVNYRINIASLLVKLEEYEQARAVYESILSYHIFSDEIYHNLAIISLKQQDFPTALNYLRKVHYPPGKKNIEFYYNFGVAWAGLHQADSSESYLQKALDENRKWNGDRKNISYGLILRYQGDLLAEKKQYAEAAARHQQAIIQFDNHFNDADIYKNPEQFTGVFSYINLFNTLTAKADVLAKLYDEKKDIRTLEASLDAYRAAFKLADYVENIYDSDEARLFINKIKYTVHNKPIFICLLLYKLTEEKKYLEDAYLFDQQNKASVLAYNVQEAELRNVTGRSADLLKQRAGIRSLITRLSLKASQTIDSVGLQKINSLIGDQEIQLGKLQEKINDDPTWRNRQSSINIPSIKELQKKLDPTTGIVSFHLSEDELLTLVISSKNFGYYRKHIDKRFFSTIDSFKRSLHQVNANEKYAGTDPSSFLYRELVSPMEPLLQKLDRLIIIPDDELNYLPFEALQDSNGRYLVQRFSIQYQYSTSLLGKDDKTRKAAGIIAFAPFASSGFHDSTGTSLPALPASGKEVSDLHGKILIDSAAKKSSFIQHANHYGIVHLATHASVSNDLPLRSFISFYPSNKNNAEEYKLYAQEIYNMALDSTSLVILSACETGTGQLVRGEGLMSLSRAFAYAGCPNIITSLWKAEDQTTAFLTQRLHHYLENGEPKDIALCKAKRDLLSSNEIDPRFKSPNYWAHLVFIGNYEPKEHPVFSGWWIAGMVLIVVIALFYFFKKKARLSKAGPGPS